MSRVNNDGPTPMNGGLKIKKEVYSKNHKRADVMTGSIEVTQDVDSYIKQTNFKTLNQDLKTFRSLLDTQTEAIEKNSADIKALSFQLREKKAEIYAAMEAKINHLSNYWFEQRIGIMCTSLGANEVMKDTLVEVMQGYKNVASELSADFKTLAVLDRNSDVFHKLDSRIEVYKKELLNTDSYKAFAEDKQLSLSNYVISTEKGNTTSVEEEGPVGNNDEPETVAISEAAMDLIMGETKVSFNEEDSSEERDFISADSIFTTYVDTVKTSYSIASQPKETLNKIIDQQIETMKKTLETMDFPERFQYSSLQSQSYMITSLNWTQEFIDFLDNYHDPEHRKIGLLFALSEFNYCSGATQMNDRKAKYLTLLSKYFGEDLCVVDVYKIFECVASKIIPAILTKLSFPQENPSDPRFYENFRDSLYDAKSNFLLKKNSSIFYSYVHKLSMVAPKNGLPEFESFNHMAQELKKNFSLLQKKELLEHFYVAIPSTDYEFTHNERIKEKSKVEKFIYENLIEQLKSFSIYLLLSRILGSSMVSRNIQSFAKNYNYFIQKTEFYSRMMQIYYSSLRDLNSGTKINKKKPMNHYKNILSTINTDNVICQDLADLKLEAQKYNLNKVVKNFDKKSPSGTARNTPFSKAFTEMKSKNEFTNLVLNLLSKKGYPINKLQDISTKETKRFIAKAKNVASML